MSVRTRTNIDVVKTLAWYLAAAYIMGLTNNLADARGLLLPGVFQPLPDLGFDYLPHIAEASQLADFFVSAFIVLVLIRVFLSKHRRELLCGFIQLHAVLMLLRSCTVALTTLPTPVHQCTIRLPASPVLAAIQPVTRLLGGISSWCHDLLFSGHSALFVISAFFLYDSTGNQLAWLIVWTMAAIGVVALIVARVHYTVDVVVGIGAASSCYMHVRHDFLVLFRDDKLGEPKEDETDDECSATDPLLPVACSRK